MRNKEKSLRRAVTSKMTRLMANTTQLLFLFSRLNYNLSSTLFLLIRAITSKMTHFMANMTSLFFVISILPVESASRISLSTK